MREEAGRSRHTTAPTTEVAASTHSAVCMFAMNGSSRASDRPLADAGEDLEQHVLGHGGGDDREHERDRDHRARVLQHRPRAAGDAAPVAGTAPIIAAVFGLLNMPEPMPTSPSQSVLCQ